jgi:tripartite-type tricarboxylate transporter receptor subunit TctC
VRRRALIAGTALLPLAFAAAAQDTFPSRPIQMIVPFPPGGVADITGRPTAHVMGKLLKQSVVVQNRPGAGRFGRRRTGRTLGAGRLHHPDGAFFDLRAAGG